VFCNFTIITIIFIIFNYKLSRNWEICCPFLPNCLTVPLFIIIYLSRLSVLCQCCELHASVGQILVEAVLILSSSKMPWFLALLSVYIYAVFLVQIILAAVTVN